MSALFLYNTPLGYGYRYKHITDTPSDKDEYRPMYTEDELEQMRENKIKKKIKKLLKRLEELELELQQYD